jgi:hypothetical protein
LAGCVRILEGFLDAEVDGFGGEEALLGADGSGEGVAAGGGGGGHDTEEGAPVDEVGAGEVAGVGIPHAQFITGDEDVAGFVDAASAGAAEHLEDFVGLEEVFDLVASVGFAGEADATEGEVDTGGEAHGGDDDAELSGFGEGFDYAGAGAVAEAAVVAGDAGFEESGDGFTDEGFLLGGESEGVGVGELAGEFIGEGFGGLAAWGEDEDGAEVFGEGFCYEAGPVAFDGGGQVELEIVAVDFLEGYGAEVMADEGGLAAEALEPFGDVLGVGDGATEEEELGGGWGEGEGELVIEAAVGVAEHLEFVDDEECGALASDESMFLGFEGGDDDWGVEVFREVTGGDADVPALVAPFGEFIIGEGAGGNRVDDLLLGPALFGPEFEDEGFTAAGGGLDDDVVALAEGGDGLLLPEVGDEHAVQRGECC